MTEKYCEYFQNKFVEINNHIKKFITLIFLFEIRKVIAGIFRLYDVQANKIITLHVDFTWILDYVLVNLCHKQTKLSFLKFPL